jgi:hypothetical protein
MDEKQEKLDPQEITEEKAEGVVVEPKEEAEKTIPEENQEQLSSFDLLWRHAFSELDEWAKRADLCDDAFLAGAKLVSESMERNQGNLKALAEQFSREFAEWEKTAREEFLMSTTLLQHFFPKKSYEDLNEQIDAIQKRTMSILRTPCQSLSNRQLLDKYPELIEQYITYRRKARKQYVKAVKHAGNIIYENQKGVINLFTRQIKSLVLPFNKYMEKQEVTNS